MATETELHDTFLKLFKAIIEDDPVNTRTRKERLLFEDKLSKADITRLELAKKFSVLSSADRLAIEDVIYREIDGYGKYIEKFLSPDNFSDDPDMLWGYQDFFSFPVTIFDTEGEYMARDKNTFLGCYALDKALVTKNYDEAIEIIAKIPNSYPLKDLFYILVFEQAHRWLDVSKHANQLLNVVRTLKEEDDEILYNFLTGAVEYYRGVAACHIPGKQKIGRNILAGIASSVDNKDFPLLKTRILLHLALVQRALKDEEGTTSDELFEQLFIVNSNDHLVKYYEDKNLQIFMTSPETFALRTDPWDYTTEPDTQTYLDEIASQEAEGNRIQVLAEAKTKLDNIIGLDGVKKQVLRLEGRYDSARKRQEKLLEKWLADGKSLESFVPPEEQVGNDHIVFKGAPGTGKTTVARIIGDIYYGIGRLKNRKFIETNRSHFVGEYLGHTAMKTQKVLESALGGVLFIDEAYALFQTGEGSGGADQFGKEAVDTILAFMENHRKDLIIIVAGYPGDMQRFLDSNEGLKSRFRSEILFESYKPEELAQILNTFFAASNGLSVPGDAMFDAFIGKLVKHAYAPHRSGNTVIDTAGNGRFVRNVYETAQDIRDENDRDDPFVITDEDIIAAFDNQIREFLD